LEELQNVRGLGKVALEKLEPLISFLDPEDDELEIVPETQDEILEAEEEVTLSPDGQKEIDIETSEILFEKETALQDKSIEPSESSPEIKKSPATIRALPASKTYSRTEMLWLVAGVALVTMVLSIIISLVILGGINGTLDFNRVQAVQQLQLDLDEARESLGGLSEKVNVFDERLTPLEGLTGRISTVEDDVGVMQQDVADALAGVEQMQTELDSFAEETARLTGRVDRFDTFLEGLRRIITELFAAPSAETAPQK
jgi:hypothetical protein